MDVTVTVNDAIADGNEVATPCDTFSVSLTPVGALVVEVGQSGQRSAVFATATTPWFTYQIFDSSQPHPQPLLIYNITVEQSLFIAV